VPELRPVTFRGGKEIATSTRERGNLECPGKEKNVGQSKKAQKRTGKKYGGKSASGKCNSRGEFVAAEYDEKGVTVKGEGTPGDGGCSQVSKHSLRKERARFRPGSLKINGRKTRRGERKKPERSSIK